jgi:hypothetical protein
MPNTRVAEYTHKSNENGLRKAYMSASFASVFLYKMLIPKRMKGVLKSTTSLRSGVMVKSQIAKSARWKPN